MVARNLILLIIFFIISKTAFSAVLSEEILGERVVTFTRDKKDRWEKHQVSRNGFVQIKYSETNNQRIDGLPKIPVLNFLVTGKDSIRSIRVNYSDSFLLNKGRIDFFKGEKCRCKEVSSLTFSPKTYFSQQKKYSYEYFGDFRGKKIYKLNILLGEQLKEEYKLFDSVKISIPNSFDLVDLNNISSIFDTKEELTLIIGKSLFEKEIREYIEFQRRKGRNIIFHEIGDDLDRNEIKQIIKKYYSESSITNVILLGNDTILPTYYTDTKFDSKTPSDYFYGIMGDRNDLIPDVFISRVSVKTSSELSNILDKWESVGGSMSISKTLGVASNEGVNPSDYEYMRMILNPLIQSHGAKTNFLDQDESNSNMDSFNQYLTNGVDIISYIGHGSGFSWPSFNQAYNVEDLEEVQAQVKYPIIFDIACQNGRFSGEGRIGEGFISGGRDNRKIGASIYYGGSVDISWHPPAVMTAGITKFIANNKGTPIYKAILFGHLYLMKSNAAQKDIIDNLKWYHLQGDPGTILL